MVTRELQTGQVITSVECSMFLWVHVLEFVFDQSAYLQTVCVFVSVCTTSVGSCKCVHICPCRFICCQIGLVARVWQERTEQGEQSWFLLWKSVCVCVSVARTQCVVCVCVCVCVCVSVWEGGRAIHYITRSYVLHFLLNLRNSFLSV